MLFTNDFLSKSCHVYTDFPIRNSHTSNIEFIELNSLIVFFLLAYIVLGVRTSAEKHNTTEMKLNNINEQF